MSSQSENNDLKSDRLSLFVFIDAFGWELVQHYPFLDDLLPVKTPLDTIFGYSSTCEPTILTGKMPRDHGHFAFFTKAKGKSLFRYYRVLGLIPRFITKRGRIRSYMSKQLKRIHGITGYFQIYNMPFKHLHRFDYTEKKDMFESGGINGGFPIIFDYLKENDIPFHKSNWRLGEEDNLAATKKSIEQGSIKLAYVYLAAMDAILHNEGKFGNGVARKIRWYEKQIQNLIEQAEQHYKEVRVFVFSDHGMTDTLSSVPLMESIEALGLRFGKEYLAAYDSTMARFWFETPTARDAIVNALEQEPFGHILSDDELAEWGCDFPEKEYGELFFLMDPGRLLCPSFMGEKSLAGMHGYHPDHKDSVAAFMTNVSDISKPVRLDDMYSLLRAETSTNPMEFRDSNEYTIKQNTECATHSTGNGDKECD